jgi:hypothetical protein
MIAEFNEDVTASLDDSDGMKDDENIADADARGEFDHKICVHKKCSSHHVVGSFRIIYAMVIFSCHNFLSSPGIIH